ncbi:MAG: hypothetical protein GQE15_11625 [Archangiaceae bacterium]|nr:hypothetical protein [Archangiaceae bacterium]
MMALLVALLTASSTFAAVWPLMEREVPALLKGVPASTALTRACHRITIIKTLPQRGTVQQGCSSARKRPCVRRRYW